MPVFKEVSRHTSDVQYPWIVLLFCAVYQARPDQPRLSNESFILEFSKQPFLLRFYLVQIISIVVD